MKVVKLAALIFIQLKANRFLTKIMSLAIVTAVALVLSTILLAPTLNANIYSWTDSSGIKHFSNVPPPPEIYPVVDVKRAYVYDIDADEERCALEKKKWTSVDQNLKDRAKQEAAANEAEAENKDDSKSMKEKIEHEKFKLQTEIARLEKMPASSFSEEIDARFWECGVSM